MLDKSTLPCRGWGRAKPDPGATKAPWRVYNVGDNSPVKLMDYNGALENALGKKAEMNMLPLQLGDVTNTCADVTDLVEQFQHKDNTPVEQGAANFVEWYRVFFRC